MEIPLVIKSAMQIFFSDKLISFSSFQCVPVTTIVNPLYFDKFLTQEETEIMNLSNKPIYGYILSHENQADSAELLNFLAFSGHSCQLVDENIENIFILSFNQIPIFLSFTMFKFKIEEV